MLALVFAATVFVRHIAHFVTLEEQYLRAALARVNFGGQWRGVAEFQRHIALPLRLEGRDVDDDAAARVGAFAQADGEHVARDAEVFDRARQREAVGRDDADIALEIDKALLVKILGVDDGGVDVGKILNSRAQ